MRLNTKSTASEILRHLAAAGALTAPQMHALAKKIRRDHDCALALWASGNQAARFIAALTDIPAQVTAQQMEQWASDFDSWGIVDCCCCYLFCETKARWQKAVAWSHRKEEFVRRAGFALMAYLAYKDKTASDEQFRKLLPLIERRASDPRHFVKKAVNWALRNIGKRNRALNAAAILTAMKIQKRAALLPESDSRSGARWIASDALRELQSAAVQNRIQRVWKKRGSAKGKATQ